jgi:apolipoprotein N-acyltransferase
VLSNRNRERSGPLSVSIAAMAGATSGLAFPPFPFWPIAFVALAPVLALSLAAGDGRRAFVISYVAFLAQTLVTLSWSLTHILPATAFASFSALLFLPMFPAAAIALAWWLGSRMGRPFGLIAAVPALLMSEAFLAHGPLGFPWLAMGHAVAETGAAPLPASIGGVALLSLWILVPNALIARVLYTRTFRGRTALTVTALLLVAAPFALPSPGPEPSGYAEFVLVQPDLDANAWADVHSRDRVPHLQQLTLQAEGGVDGTLVVWPETALPVLDPSRPELLGDLEKWVARESLTLLTGAITVNESGHFHNSALFFAAGSSAARYDKRHLVAFAEFVPGSEQLPWLRAAAVPAGGVSGYRRGVAATAFDDGGVRIGPLICLETLFGRSARAYVRELDADVLVGISQMGWWRAGGGARQHLASSRLRAAETGRALVYVSVNGPSTVFLPDGRIHFQAAVGEGGAHRVSVPLFNGRTFFVQTGDLVTPSAGALLLILCCLGALAGLRREDRGLHRT